MNSLFKKIIKDIEVELTDEFDRNFERKGFFDRKWSQNKLRNRRGSMMIRSGALRRSIKSNIVGDRIFYNSSVPYANLQNEGGEIKVTAKMKSFFWAMFYKATNGSKSGSKQRQKKLGTEAEQWRNLALMKPGQKMTIEQRQFIGEHSHVKKLVNNVIDDNLKEINEYYKAKIDTKGI